MMDALLRWDDYRPKAVANFNEKRDGADCEGEHWPPNGVVANPLRRSAGNNLPFPLTPDLFRSSAGQPGKVT
jgi:hypothetical protein